MSFSSGIKNELAGLPLGSACCKLSELAGIMLSAGSMHLAGGEGMKAEIATESLPIARRVYRLFRLLYAADPQIERHERHRLNRNMRYHVTLSDSAARRMLTDIGVLGGGDVFIGIKPELVRLSCCEGAFLRGLFLGCGSVSDPEKGYHLELVLEDEQFARSAVALMAGVELGARVTQRNGSPVAYIKDADHISRFLALTGAHAGMLKFESVRVEKGMRNSVNRVVNCDTANADRTVRASGRQLDSIRLIDSHGGLGSLPAGLREAAEARLDNPDATLEKLAEDMGGISKSGLNHRFRRLEGMAVEIRLREETPNEPKRADNPQR